MTRQRSDQAQGQRLPRHQRRAPAGSHRGPCWFVGRSRRRLSSCRAQAGSLCAGSDRPGARQLGVERSPMAALHAVHGPERLDDPAHRALVKRSGTGLAGGGGGVRRRMPVGREYSDR